MKSQKVVLGILAGFAAGALVGILFAPKKGYRTRKKIIKKGEDYADGIKEKFEDLLDAIKDKYESGQKGAGALMAEGKTKFDEVKKAIS